MAGHAQRRFGDIFEPLKSSGFCTVVRV